MKKWVVRFLSLLVFNVVVLLLIGWLTPARVGWSALWAGVILTALTIWIKPLITNWFRSMAAKSAHQRTKVGEKVVQGALVFLVALIVWILTVVFSGVSVGRVALGLHPAARDHPGRLGDLRRDRRPRGGTCRGSLRQGDRSAAGRRVRRRRRR